MWSETWRFQENQVPVTGPVPQDLEYAEACDPRKSHSLPPGSLSSQHSEARRCGSVEFHTPQPWTNPWTQLQAGLPVRRGCGRGELLILSSVSDYLNAQAYMNTLMEISPKFRLQWGLSGPPQLLCPSPQEHFIYISQAVSICSGWHSGAGKAVPCYTVARVTCCWSHFPQPSLGLGT